MTISKKPKKIPQHTGVGIFTTANYVIYHQKSINEEVAPKEKEIVEGSELDIKNCNSLTVEILSTLKGMHIHDPSKYLITVMAWANIKIRKGSRITKKNIWKDGINVGKPLKKFKLQLLKLLKLFAKFSSIWNGHLPTIKGT